MRTNRELCCYKMQIQYLLTTMCILRMSQRIKCEHQRVAKGGGIHIMVMKNVYHIIPLKNLVKYQRCSPDHWRGTRNSLKRKLDGYCLANEKIDSAYYMQFSYHILRYNIEL